MRVPAPVHAKTHKKPRVFCCFRFTTALRSLIIKLTREESKHFCIVLFARVGTGAMPKRGFFPTNPQPKGDLDACRDEAHDADRNCQRTRGNHRSQ